ncbi:hypothetical protein [Paractinoplanes maris]|uniref:hypothetical protein n=1 Tax=Paractinoplanes maris TaxID=1734446 RepID=UPI00201FF724|nr:hypothetical protein [Actinoplanes maris]
MPRATLTVNNITKAGIAVPTETNGDTVNGHSLPNDGAKTFLLARNSNGASTARTLTVRLQGSVDGQAITPKTYSIPAGQSRYIGPFDTSRYGSSVAVDVDNAELKITAFRLS